MPLKHINPTIRNIGIYTKNGAPDANNLAMIIKARLEAAGVNVYLEQRLAKEVGCSGIPEQDIPPLCDLVIVMGGDGTFIATGRQVSKFAPDVPILGVNMGTLGFLTEIQTDEILQFLEKALVDGFGISKRAVLNGTVHRDGSTIGDYIVLNDFVINKGALARIIKMKVYVDDLYLTTYSADGLIVSTPTGSTAYNLSAGGPIIFPGADCLVITPICPHMLTNRPIILRGDSKISIEVACDDDEVMLTADGQQGIPLKQSDVITINGGSPVSIVQSDQRNYFGILRAKLNWNER